MFVLQFREPKIGKHAKSDIFYWSWNNITVQKHRPNPTHSLSQKSEGNYNWITRVQKHLTLAVTLKQTFAVYVSLKSDWLIGMLIQEHVVLGQITFAEC